MAINPKRDLISCRILRRAVTRCVCTLETRQALRTKAGRRKELKNILFLLIKKPILKLFKK